MTATRVKMTFSNLHTRETVECNDVHEMIKAEREMNARHFGLIAIDSLDKEDPHPVAMLDYFNRPNN